MFKVTDAAAARLAAELERLEIPDRKVIRFCRDDEGMHLRVSELHPGDKGFAHAGRTVLVVEERLVERLSRRTLDTRETADGTKLFLAESASSAA